MFPDDDTLPLPRPVTAVSKCSSPELDSDSFSARGTPEGTLPVDVPLVKYVKWNVPSEEAEVGEHGSPRPIRRAVAREIVPDTETVRLKKTLAPSHKRRHSRKPSFEIGSAVDSGAAAMSDSEVDERHKWHASSRCSPLSVETSTEKPDIESISALSELYREYPYTQTDHAERDNPRGTYSGHQSMRRSSEETVTGAIPRGCHRISDIAAAVRQQSARSSTDTTALKILSGRGLNSQTGTYDDPKAFGEGRAILLSPLPNAMQLRAAKAAHHTYDTDSETMDSVSLLESGYSDHLTDCPHGFSDWWTREAEQNPYSNCEALEPRFKWLRRSVGPFTALAGALLVFYGPRVMKFRRGQN